MPGLSAEVSSQPRVYRKLHETPADQLRSVAPQRAWFPNPTGTLYRTALESTRSREERHCCCCCGVLGALKVGPGGVYPVSGGVLSCVGEVLSCVGCVCRGSTHTAIILPAIWGRDRAVGMYLRFATHTVTRRGFIPPTTTLTSVPVQVCSTNCSVLGRRVWLYP